MPIAYIGIGSNIDPEANIAAALRLLGRSVRVIALSTFYRTDPLGPPGSPPFINGAVKIETDIPPRKLKFDVLRKIEDALGRRRTEDKYSPRPIDLDIMVYGDLRVHEPDLNLPDPDILAREFVAHPLFELDPGMILPVEEMALADVVGKLPAGAMQPLTEFTSALREEFENEQGTDRRTDP
ncbi:MAG: 2-amino-4-hydroxy-6-hydroxymethyldihydropteridine diphosphokinase [Armatimonadetes bacterium]|nr:2-amino-4-hydroxy-6-hydroxymethyldihydropteridine diphosphokinase [Armatimonadota bacterium]